MKTTREVSTLFSLNIFEHISKHLNNQELIQIHIRLNYEK